jgi:hypothetical protein
MNESGGIGYNLTNMTQYIYMRLHEFPSYNSKQVYNIDKMQTICGKF